MGKLGSFNHLRLTVSDVDRAAPFFLPVMAFLGPRLEERKPGRMTREAPPGISPQWYILTAVTADSVYPSHDQCSPGRHPWHATRTAATLSISCIGCCRRKG